jgi:GNAT superfamily N-acetyltransferase
MIVPPPEITSCTSSESEICSILTISPLEQHRSVVYFKRYRMEIELAELPTPRLPDGYTWVPWDGDQVEDHAQTLCRSFCEQIDSIVFPSLRTEMGCRYLMSEIRKRSGFLPEATWLAAWRGQSCGAIQGLRDWNGQGALQNLGVEPEHQGCGVGTALLLQALHGFRRAGLRKAFLEVTAENEGAVRLYRRLGFLRKKTIYKAVELAPAEAMP